MGLADTELDNEGEVMLSDAQRSHLPRQLVTMRIIAGALCAGVVVFGVIVLLVDRHVTEEPRLAFVALVVSVGCIMAAAILPRVIGKRGQSSLTDVPGEQSERPRSPESDEAYLVSRGMAIYQTRLIISLAILEGAALLNLIAYMLEGQAVNVAVAFVLLTLMMIQFPSRGRTED